MLGFRRIGKLPHPEQTLFTPASVNDVAVFKEAWPGIVTRTFWGDKKYFVNELNEHMVKHQNSEMLTPVKAVKGIPEVINKGLKQLMIYFQLRFPKSDNQSKQYLIG